MSKKQPSRGDRWRDAISTAQEALAKAQEAAGEVEAAMSDLRDIQSEFQDWRDNLPENLQQSALGEKLDAVADMDLDWSPDEPLSDAEQKLSEAEGTDLPQGFGRD